MRTLNKLEMQEFNRTFDFINHYIGSSFYLDGIESIHDLRFDGNKCNQELITFIQTKFNGKLKEVNRWFNDVTKDKVLPNLIKYCFENRVQPHRLRMVGEFSVHKIDIETQSFSA